MKAAFMDLQKARLDSETILPDDSYTRCVCCVMKRAESEYEV